MIWAIILGLMMACLVFRLFTELSRRPDGSVGPASTGMNLGVAIVCLFVFSAVWGLEKKLFRDFAPFFFFSTPGRLISFVANVAFLGIPSLLLIRIAKRRNRQSVAEDGAQEDGSTPR